MKLIDNWERTLRKSYTLWLTYIMLGAGMAMAAINGFDLMPPDLANEANMALKWLIFVCTILQIPARVIHQPNLPSKA